MVGKETRFYHVHIPSKIPRPTTITILSGAVRINDDKFLLIGNYVHIGNFSHRQAIPAAAMQHKDKRKFHALFIG